MIIKAMIIIIKQEMTHTTDVQVFTSLALFSVLISPLNAFPWVINGLVEAWVSLKRVSQFLSLSEQGHYYHLLSPEKVAVSVSISTLATSISELVC